MVFLQIWFIGVFHKPFLEDVNLPLLKDVFLIFAGFLAHSVILFAEIVALLKFQIIVIFIIWFLIIFRCFCTWILLVSFVLENLNLVIWFAGIDWDALDLILLHVALVDVVFLYNIYIVSLYLIEKVLWLNFVLWKCRTEHNIMN